MDEIPLENVFSKSLLENNMQIQNLKDKAIILIQQQAQSCTYNKVC